MAKRPYKRSGFYGGALVPAPETPVGEALRDRREALIADLGGRDQCTTAQLAMVDLVVAAWWKLDSVTGYLLTLPSLVDKRHRRVWQVVKDRAALASQLQSLLRDIGLERRAKKVLELDEYVRQNYPPPSPPPAEPPPPSEPALRDTSAGTAFARYIAEKVAAKGRAA
jgi:hypothetical protein